MKHSVRPDIGELIAQLQRLRGATCSEAWGGELAERLDVLADLLQHRLDRLMVDPKAGEEVLQPGQPPNLDLFGQNPQAFEACMAESRVLVLEEIAYWRALLEEVEEVLVIDGERISPPVSQMNRWLIRLEQWLNRTLELKS